MAFDPQTLSKKDSTFRFCVPISNFSFPSMTWVGKVVTQTSVKGLEFLGLVPKGTHDVGEQLKIAADALVAGGSKKLFTPMMLFVAKKPANK